MLEVLHWLPIRQRIEYRVASLEWQCQLRIAPIYLIDLCRSMSGNASGCSLRYAGTGGVLSVPFARTTLMQVCTFALMARRWGMACLLSCASYLGRFPTHAIVVLKPFFLPVMESGAPLSSRELEEALYKFLNE